MSGSLRAILRPQRWTLRSGPQGPAGDGGAGAVDSVNGQTGVVVLDAAAVGADAAGTAAGLVAGVTAASLGAVPTSRTISTTAPLTGGGDLSANRTLAITVGATGGVQGWSANLDSYATVAPSAFSLTLLDDADQAAWRSTLGLGSAATQTAQVAPATSRVPLSRSGLARLRPGWAREVGIGTPTAGEDNTLGYEVGDTWTYQGRHYVAESVATGAANWIAGLIASDATATPAASKIPIANGSGKLDGWISDATDVVKGLVLLGAATGAQAYSAILTAITALGTSGLIARTGAGTVAARTVTGAGIAAVTNGDGVSGNPTVTVPAQPSLIVMRPATLTGYQILNVPAAETAYPEGRFVQVPVDLTNRTEYRILTRNQSAVTAKLRIKASTTGSGGTYSDLASVAAAGDLTLNTGAIATAEGPWTTIAAGLRAPVVLDVYTVGGNTTEDPTLQYIYVEVR